MNMDNVTNSRTNPLNSAGDRATKLTARVTHTQTDRATSTKRLLKRKETAKTLRQT